MERKKISLIRITPVRFIFKTEHLLKLNWLRSPRIHFGSNEILYYPEVNSYRKVMRAGGVISGTKTESDMLFRIASHM